MQYERLAEYYLENGNPKSALPFGKKILKIREKVLGNRHIEIAKSYLQLAYLYGFLHFKDYCPDEADPVKNVEDAGPEKEHYRLAMESAIQEYGENSVEAAICY